jgi:hypothetical protein
MAPELLPAAASSKAHSVNEIVFFMVFLLLGRAALELAVHGVHGARGMWRKYEGERD